ncbi:MAG: carboxylate-amine ligase [Ferrovibrio sp.]|uniref:carboxylate-amine ligase n=1 Tax=Ferrovibrio sp. TaxID=1917215 RepID=UPI00261AB42A|nr:carboxylate-amine ligase [Ferrovibrio sp.]MCW0233582.1 carboxylate-amine ligase [Ferrovibrio sp.]
MKPAYTIGIEEEYFLAETGSKNAISRMPKALIRRARSVLGNQVTPELLQSQIEVVTPVCQSLDEARQYLRRYRSTLRDTTAEFGLEVFAAGTHPMAEWSEQTPTDKPRYAKLANDLKFLAMRNMMCGMHIHVEVTDPHVRIDIMNRVLPFLPTLLALSTSSPFWRKHPTGLMGYRLAAYDELPRTGIPDFFVNLADYNELIATMVTAGVIEDASHVWWAIRPSARFPTLELRIGDSCTHMEDTLCIAALYRCLIRALGRVPELNGIWRNHTRLLIEENRWRAQRYGTTEGLIDFNEKRLVPFADVIEGLLALIAEDAEALDCVQEVRHARTILTRGTSAAQQMALYRAARDGGASRLEALRQVVGWLAQTTAE